MQPNRSLFRSLLMLAKRKVEQEQSQKQREESYMDMGMVGTLRMVHTQMCICT